MGDIGIRNGFEEVLQGVHEKRIFYQAVVVGKRSFFQGHPVLSWRLQPNGYTWECQIVETDKPESEILNPRSLVLSLKS